MSPSLPRIADVFVVSNHQTLTNALKKVFQDFNLTVVSQSLDNQSSLHLLNQTNYFVVVIDEALLSSNQSLLEIFKNITSHHKKLLNSASKGVVLLLNHNKSHNAGINLLIQKGIAKLTASAVIISNSHFGSSVITENSTLISGLVKNIPSQLNVPSKYQEIFYPLPISSLAKAVISYLFSFSGPQPMQEIFGQTPLSIYNFSLKVRDSLAKNSVISSTIAVNPSLKIPIIFPHRLTVTITSAVIDKELDNWLANLPLMRSADQNVSTFKIKAKSVSKEISQNKNVLKPIKKSKIKIKKNKKHHFSSQLFFRVGVITIFFSVIAFVMVVIGHFSNHVVSQSLSNIHDQAILAINAPLRAVTRSLSSRMPQIVTSSLISLSRQAEAESSKIMYSRDLHSFTQSLLQMTPSFFSQNQPTSFFTITNMHLNNLLSVNSSLRTNENIFNNQLEVNTLHDQFRQLQLGNLYLESYRWLNQDSHKIAVVVQDDSERRSSGGFISGIVFVSLENGHISEITSNSVYALDGDLNGQVTPPPSLAKALNESSWYLRDANWFISVPDAASSVAWFIEKETGQSVDAIFFLNASSVKNLFSFFHSLEIDNQVVTDTNLNEYVNPKSVAADAPQIFHDHLVSLTAAIIKATQTSLALNNQNLSRLWWQILTSNQSSLNVYRNHSWQNISGAGDYTLLQCDAANSIPCQEVTIGFADNNVGLNRLSLNTKLEPTLLLTFNPASISVQQTVKLTNQNQNIYQSVLRFADLSQATNVSVTLDNKIMPENAYSTDQESFFQTVDVPLQVPANQSQLVKLAYDKSYTTSAAHTFAFKLVNQPGVGERSYNLSLINKTNKPWLITNQPQTSNQSYQEINLVTDQTILVVFPSGV